MKNKKHLFLTIIFFSILLLPQVIDKTVKVKKSTIKENRNLAKFPTEFKYRKIALQLEEYYNDRIPFRSLLVDYCKQIQSLLFPFTLGNLVVGDNDFCFYRLSGREDSIDQYRGKVKLSLYDLEKARKFLVKLDSILRSKNIKFLMVIAPNKVQVYPEHLPERRQYVAATAMPDLQICEYLKQHHPNIPIKHLLPSLLEAKKYWHDNLYYRQDTHWSYVGGFIGATEIIRHFSPELPKVDFKKTKLFSTGKIELRDIVNQSRTKIELKQYPELKVDVPTFNGEYKAINSSTIYTFNPTAVDKRRVLMNRDSFTISMMPYISQHFREVYYIWSHDVSIKTIEKINPDIYILEYVARILFRMKTKFY